MLQKNIHVTGCLTKIAHLTTPGSGFMITSFHVWALLIDNSSATLACYIAVGGARVSCSNRQVWGPVFRVPFVNNTAWGTFVLISLCILLQACSTVVEESCHYSEVSYTVTKIDAVVLVPNAELSRCLEIPSFKSGRVESPSLVMQLLTANNLQLHVDALLQNCLNIHR